MNPQQRTTLFASMAASLAATLLSVACTATGSEPTEPSRVPPPITDLGGSAYEAAARVMLPETSPTEDPGLHNVYRLSDRIVSGAEPHGEDAFAALQRMGIRTILSVDGKTPDQALANQFGMTYVHVPIQYRGIGDDNLMRIAKTFREKPGPFFVHCFHGKHRGPAAAAVGRLVLDGASREQALAEMRQWCGTSESYEGLYRVIAESSLPDEASTRVYDWDFPAAHSFAGFRQAMIEVSRAGDNLKYLSKREWQPGADHPDVDALNEAIKLVDLFQSANSVAEVADKPADFRGWMGESVTASMTLRDNMRSWRDGAAEVGAVDRAFQKVRELCTSCHRAYRN